MTYKEVLKKLESIGTAQNRKIYARHGIGQNMFGVSFANLQKLHKAINVDHALAGRLWKSGNHDARILATMIADPARTTGAVLDAWVKDLDNYVLTDAFAGFACRTSHARKRMEKWSASKREWVGRAGWHLITHMAQADRMTMDLFFEEWLGVIESEIHRSKNRVKDAMNGTLIAIGMRNARLEKLAIATARRIGKVAVDHGDTGCKTPAAEAYIKKARPRARKRVRATVVV